MPKYPLNKAQREAVEYTSGPLLIVAGAGTGKTTVITEKIAYLLENKLAKPEEILALAFNDKAAEEIQERVDELLDIGYTEIAISTFHSFCQRILERHAIDIGLSNQFELLTETGAWLLLRQHLEELNLDYYCPVGNPTKHIHELLKHFSKCKDELISPEDYLAYAEGLSKDNGTANLEDKTRVTELANAYHAYNQLLLDAARLDFGDLIYYVNKLFQTRPNILAQFQTKYKYILVDEFQDVNWSQYNLVQMMADAKAQLTVVGDDDQSIYAFRGASVSNILRFQDDFPKVKKIVLNENYRSNQEILDKAYESIQNNNPDRLEVKLKIDKKLVAAKKASVILSEAPARHDLPSGMSGRKNPSEKKGRDPSAMPQDDKAVVHIHAATLEDEVKSVVDEIIRLKQIDENATWDDFAVLVRANNHAEPFLNALEMRGIPYEFLAASGLYRQPVILDCINYFKLLVDHCDGVAVFRLLRLPFLHFSENDLQKFTSSAKRKSYPYYEALKRCREFGLSERSVAACDQLISLVHNGLKESRYLKPTILLYNFLEKSGYLNFLKEEEEAGNAAIIRQNKQLKQFFDYLETFEKIAPDAHVVNFMEEFENIRNSGDRGKIFDLKDTPDSVNILTVHGAKGLEYKYVFIVNLVEERFPTRTKGDGIEIPLALIKEQLPEGDSHYEEERRLFYVAMTRAKERLYFTSATNYGGVRTKKISRFLDELGYRASDQEAIKQELTEKRAGQVSEKKEIIYELPKSFSFSHIQMYESCPYKYKLAHVLSLPSKGSHYFSFGTTIHSTLQAFYLRVQELNAVEQGSLFETSKKKKSNGSIHVPSLDDLLAIYESKWIDDWYQGAKQKTDYFEKGKKVLRTFYAAQENNWTIPEFLESFFKIKIGDHLLSGRIDRIDKLPDGSLEIIDYKTGKAKEKLATADKEQLLIYQIATEQLPEYKNIGCPSKLTYYYLEDEMHTSFIGDNKDLEKLQQNILETVGDIKAQKFAATPSQFVCEHCDFRDICEFRV